MKDVDDYFDEAKRIFGKSPRSNFGKMDSFLKEKDIDEVIVLGMSLSKQDRPYFEEFFVPRFGTLPWKVSYLDSNDKDEKTKILESLGLSCTLETIEEIFGCE